MYIIIYIYGTYVNIVLYTHVRTYEKEYIYI